MVVSNYVNNIIFSWSLNKITSKAEEKINKYCYLLNEAKAANVMTHTDSNKGKQERKKEMFFLIIEKTSNY